MRPTLVLLTVFYILLLTTPVTLRADTEQTLKTIDRSIRLRQYTQAVEQLKPLLKLENAQAQYRMAGLHRSGKGVKKSATKALNYYRQAAEKGLADAQYALASLLEKQGSAEQKKSEVIKWYQAAAEQGHRKAKQKLARLERQTTRTEPVNYESVFSSVRINDRERIQQLIDQQVDLNFLDSKQRTPFMVALLSEHPELAQLLLPHTRHLDLADANQDRPLHIASNNGYRNLVKSLLERGVDINARNKLGNTALILATRHDDAPVIELLLSHHADPLIANRKSQTAPLIAATLNLKNARQLFHKYQINLPERDKDYAAVDIKAFEKTVAQSNSIYTGWPLINIASLLGETAIVKQLLRQGSNINARDKNGNSALHRAASKGQLATVKLLVSRGIQIDGTNKKNETALFLAAGQGKLKVVQYLVGKGANSSIISRSKSSPLSTAISNLHPATALYLSTRKLASLPVHQALFLAIQNKMEPVAINLVKRDTLLLQNDDKNRSVLWHSVNKGLYKTTRVLLETGKVSLEQQDDKGYTALARAAVNGDYKIFNLLLKYDANIQTLTKEKSTILMLAVLSGNNQLIKRVASLNVDFNARNNAGDTALILAAGRGNLKAVKRLIEIPVDIQVRNRHDQNAYQVALAAGHQKTADYIREKSGRLFKLFN